MQLVRLSSGEEIIGNIEQVAPGSDKGHIKITDGYSLIPAGEGKIGFMPFMAYTEAAKGVTIPNRFVMFVVEPQAELVQQINSMNSGIVVPPKQGIITGA
jgi:hypothetical protein|tara:strand:- start:1499 stop:1798 length:300 start_codon:yes stop_codon:yes gene_type:complete